MTTTNVTCCHKDCYATIILPEGVESKLRRTGEWFYCPSGHRQHFTPGPSKEQGEISELKRLLAREQSYCSDLWRRYIALEERLGKYQAAWLDDLLGEDPSADVYEAPDGTVVWVAPCGAHGHFLESTPDHAAGLLNAHVKRHECGPPFEVEVKA